VLPATAGAPAQECTGSTYAPAFNRLRTCLPCQSGLAAPDNYNGTHDNKLDVCQVPPGKFWELNVVRDCPKGLYRENFVRTDDKIAIACRSCPEGWTTANIGTPLLRLCNGECQEEGCLPLCVLIAAMCIMDCACRMLACRACCVFPAST
jgi:hypothetical protein